MILFAHMKIKRHTSSAMRTIIASTALLRARLEDLVLTFTR